MANMSYCRFQNTLEDLRDCANEMEEKGINTLKQKLSPDEKRAMLKMIEICNNIVEMDIEAQEETDYEDEDDESLEDED